MKKKEILFVVVILIFAFAWLLFQRTGGKVAAQAVVQLEGRIFGTYDLKEDQMIAIENHNILEIQEGRIHMKEALCPDQTCVKQGWISRRGDSIVCLPNKVIVTLENTVSELDAVVR